MTKAERLFAFYISRTAGYRQLRKMSLQDIDMGIAMCHFELTVKDLGLKGSWHREDTAPQVKSLEYVADWRAEG